MLSTTRLSINALSVGRKTFKPGSLNNLAETWTRSRWLRPASRRGFTHHTAAQQGKKPAYVYPDLIQIYRAPTKQTGANGIGRLVTMGLFVASIPAAMNIYSNPDASNWWIPGVLLGAAIPMTLTVLLCGPWTMAIQMNLPSRARRSREDLQRFISRLPPDTPLALQFLRWKPWPTTRQVTFSDLRRLRPSRIRMSNLEHMPDAVAAKMQNVSGLRVWMVRRYMGQFWVVMDDASGGQGVVKDVWRHLWEQIPMEGEDTAVEREKRDAVSTEMPVVQSNAIALAESAPQKKLEQSPGSVKSVTRNRRPPPPVRQPVKQKQKQR